MVKKNLECNSDDEIHEIMKTVKFVHSFKAKDEKRVNWIVQLSAKYYTELLKGERAYMMWRSYRIREYVNITRCYKCHDYGHTARSCSSQHQLCNLCGSKDHLRNACSKKGDPECVNCVRAKRKDTKHEVHNSDCPEYKRHVE